MKPIKITEKNKVKIEERLKSGKVVKRSFDFNDLQEILMRLNHKLLNLGIAKKYWKGIRFDRPFGDCVNNSYGWPAKEQTITLVYRSTGWFLTDVKETLVQSAPHGRGNGKQPDLYLTKSALDSMLRNQRIIIIENLQQKPETT